MNQTLSKAEKLKRDKIIKQLFEQGNRVKAFPLGLIYLEGNFSENAAVQVGFSVPKRIHKTAVARNRLKRLMREVYRKQKSDFASEKNSYAIMFIYTGKQLLTYAAMERAFLKLNHRFHNKIEKPT